MNSEESKDLIRFEWLIQRGVAWRGCFQGTWKEGEWLYAIQDARKEIDEAMHEENILRHEQSGKGI